MNALSCVACIALLALAAGGVAAQEREFAVGGGYHLGVPSWLALPSTPTVDARYTRWGSGRWGFTTRVMVGLSGSPGRRARHRRALPSDLRAAARAVPGVGLGDRRHRRRAVGRRRAERAHGREVPVHLPTGPRRREPLHLGGHILAVELLNSHELTDRLTLRVGAAAVLPMNINPTVLLVWKL